MREGGSTGDVGGTTGDMGERRVDVGGRRVDMDEQRIHVAQRRVYMDGWTDDVDATTVHVGLTTVGLDGVTVGVDGTTGDVDRVTVNVDGTAGDVDGSTGDVDGTTGDVDGTTDHVDGSADHVDGGDVDGSTAVPIGARWRTRAVATGSPGRIDVVIRRETTLFAPGTDTALAPAMRPLVPGALLLPFALVLGACAEEPEVPPASPTAMTVSGLPPPLYVSMTSGSCDDKDASGCEVRCAAGDGDACSRVNAEYEAADVKPAPVQVVQPHAAVQFYGPVNTVNIAPPASR